MPTPRWEGVVSANAESVLKEGDPAGRLAMMQLRTPNKGEAARRAALTPLWGAAGAPTTPSKPDEGALGSRNYGGDGTPGPEEYVVHC